MGKFTDQQKIDIVKEYQDGLTLKNIGQKYNVCDGTIRGLLIRRNIKLRHKGHRIYQFNYDFFDKIDTEEKAYWLGFIYAEGNVYKSTLQIELSIIDKEHLEKFKKSILYSGNITDRKAIRNKKLRIYSRIRLNSIDFIEKISKVGLIPNKGNTIQVPDISQGLIRHFMRGFLDGDGWITIRKKPTHNVWHIGFASNSYNFLKNIQNWVEQNINKKGSLFKRKNRNCWQLTWSGNGYILELANLLYKDATIFMDRKMKKYLIMKNYLENHKIYKRYSKEIN